jgi:hypothetical protein
MLVGSLSGWGSAGSLSWFCTACGLLRYQRWMLALSCARARVASVGLSWGRTMSYSGKNCLPGVLWEESAGVRGCCCVLPEDEGSDAWSSRTNLCGGLEGVTGRCWSSSLSLDGRGLRVFVCGWGLVARGAVVAERSSLKGRLSGMGSLGLGILRLLLLVLRCCGGVG